MIRQRIKRRAVPVVRRCNVCPYKFVSRGDNERVCAECRAKRVDAGPKVHNTAGDARSVLHDSG